MNISPLIDKSVIRWYFKAIRWIIRWRDKRGRVTMQDMDIEQIPMSVRSYNALKNHGIMIVEELMNLTEADLMRIRNLGAKSIQEILKLQQCIKDGDYLFITNSDNQSTALKRQLIKELVIKHHIGNYKVGVDHYQVIVSNLFEEWEDNIHIDDLKLSARPSNCLLLAGIQTVQDILNLTYQELSELPRMGQKSIDEILTKLYSRTQVVEEYEMRDALDFILDYFIKDIMNCHVSFPKQEIILRIKYVFSTLPKEELDYVLSLIEMDREGQMDEILECYVYTDSGMTNALRNYILNLLEKDAFTFVPFDEIIGQMPLSIQRNGYARDCINELIYQNKIEQCENEIRIRYPSILEYADSIQKSNVRQALLGRLRGETLEEIGGCLGVTRERIRQIISATLKKRPIHVKEDEYQVFYEKYEFTKDEFLTIFNADEYIWNYLKITYKGGKLPLEALLEDSQLTSTLRKRVHRLIYQDYLHIGDNLIKKSRLEISRYLISEYCKEVMSIDDFWVLYHDFITEHGLGENERIKYPLRTMENAISDYDIVAWQYGRKFRYYPMAIYDFEAFFERIQWNQYHDVELSTYRIFCDYPEVMVEYDIQNEYELHNIIKKLPVELIGEQVRVTNMPYLAFGECDRAMQTIELLLELAPISREDLAEVFEKKYGHRRDTVSGYFSNVIDEYYYDGMYRVDETPLSQEEFFALKENLKEDFYFLNDIKQLYLRLFPKGDLQKINAYNIKQLGFKVNSSYAFSNTYASADAFFRNLLTQNDRIDFTYEYTELWNIPAFRMVIEQLREDFELFEYAPSRFIHYRCLQQVRITKDYLKQYVQEALLFANEEYFTIHSLRLAGFEHDLDELGFEDWFYESLIRYHPSVQFRRFKDRMLLKQHEEKICLIDFLEELLQNLISIDIYDFIDLVKSRYGIELNRDRLLAVIKMTSLHYDSIMEKIYLNYEIYYEEV